MKIILAASALALVVSSVMMWIGLRAGRGMQRIQR